MIRALIISTAIVTTMAAAPPPQQRQDEYLKSTGFAVDIMGAAEDEGWEHFTDALITIGHSPAAGQVKANSLRETVLKAAMRDENGNRVTVELRPCEDFSAAVCLVITTVDLPQSLDSWLKPLLRKNARIDHRDLLITVSQKNGGKRTYSLMDAFPTAFSFVEIAAAGNTGAAILWKLEVRVQRVEMA
jgi:hypothetical protein